MLSNLVTEIDSNTCSGRFCHILQMLQFLKSAVNIKHEKSLSFKHCAYFDSIKKTWSLCASGSIVLSSFSRSSLSAHHTTNVELMPEQLRLYNRGPLQKNRKSLRFNELSDKCVFSITKANDPSSNGNTMLIFLFPPLTQINIWRHGDAAEAQHIFLNLHVNLHIQGS